MNKVLILLISFNRQPFLKKTLENLFNNTSTPFDLIIMDNGSAKPVKDLLANFENKTYKNGSTSKVIHNSSNIGTTDTYSEIRKYLKEGQYYLKLDNDVVVPKNKEWLSTLIQIIESNNNVEVVAYPTREKKDTFAWFGKETLATPYGELAKMKVNVSPCSLYSYKFINSLVFKKVGHNNFIQVPCEDEEKQISDHSAKTGYGMYYLYVNDNLSIINENSPVFLDSVYSTFKDELNYYPEMKLYNTWKNSIKSTKIYKPFFLREDQYALDSTKLDMQDEII